MTEEHRQSFEITISICLKIFGIILYIYYLKMN